MNKEEAFKLFDELPPPIAEMAKRNFDDVWSARRRDTFRQTLPARALALSFLWSDSKEGHSFWEEVADAAEYGQPYPSVKGLPS